MSRWQLSLVLLGALGCTGTHSDSGTNAPADAADLDSGIADIAILAPDQSMIEDVFVAPLIDVNSNSRDASRPQDRPCDPRSTADTDWDRDGLSDAREQEEGTSVCHSDSDNDGFIDLAELMHGSDPWDPDDGLENYLTLPADPGWLALDVDLNLRLRQTDMYLVLDNSGSMQGFINALAENFGRMVELISRVVPDATYGVASFINYSGHGGGNLPFRLLQQATTDVARVQESLDGIRASGGGLHEASLEALYQTLTGIGYDQNCNGQYDEGTDVPPFSSHHLDAFGGTARGTEDEETPGAGKVGGVGFRSGAYKIIVYATDEQLLDPDRGDATPGGCPQDAGHNAVVQAANSVGVKLIGVSASYRAQGDEVQRAQMERLAVDTNSVLDLGDGVERPLVLSTNEGDLVQLLLDRVARLLGAVRFERVNAAVVSDPLMVTRSFAPPTLGPIEPADFGRPHSFRLELDAIGKMEDAWQVTTVGVQLTADDGVDLAYQQYIVAIPPLPL